MTEALTIAAAVLLSTMAAITAYGYLIRKGVL